MLFALSEHVSIHGLLRALTVASAFPAFAEGFNPRALTSPDISACADLTALLVSIHGLLRALTKLG